MDNGNSIYNMAMGEKSNISEIAQKESQEK